MSFKSSILIFLILMGLGLSAFMAVNFGLYPIAVVDWHVITAKTLNKDYEAALRYFHNALLTYGSDPAVLKNENSKKEIKRAALNKLITDFLIYKEAKKRVGGDLEKISEKIIDQNINTAQLTEAAKEIYGLSLEDFKTQVLTAQANREILEGRMLASNENFSDWLKNASHAAKVVVLLSDLSWNGEQVVFK